MPVRILLIGLANFGGMIYLECGLHHFMVQTERLDEKETEDYVAHKFTPSCIHSLHDYGYRGPAVSSSYLGDFLTQMYGIWI